MFVPRVKRIWPARLEAVNREKETKARSNENVDGSETGPVRMAIPAFIGASERFALGRLEADSVARGDRSAKLNGVGDRVEERE